ncbi:hypothetical protein CNR37_00177 [Pseudomonas phage ventosus]|uniref:Cyanophage baseplate Pam3 plug gp18 domain-containing protein n=1 Tax=Pseudomonas phage ventosus TaxID=2048980 RepID=A0A2H4P872_9CAUD|nr:hypothetical protein CNR37_00177 [Pseudomonas phage ventosus]
MTVYIEMPLFSDEKYRYSIPLEGTSWQFTFYWNGRAGQWHMDILREDQTPLVLGQPLVAQYPMLIDYNLEEQGLTGYFLLMPVNVEITTQITEDSSVVPEFFKLYYVYLPEA